MASAVGASAEAEEAADTTEDTRPAEATEVVTEVEGVAGMRRIRAICAPTTQPAAANTQRGSITLDLPGGLSAGCGIEKQRKGWSVY